LSYVNLINKLVNVLFREDLITLGGTKQVGNESLEVDPIDTAQIMERCERLCPRLKVGI